MTKRLTLEQKNEVKKDLQNNVTFKEISKKYEISLSTISRLKKQFANGDEKKSEHESIKEGDIVPLKEINQDVILNADDEPEYLVEEELEEENENDRIEENQIENNESEQIEEEELTHNSLDDEILKEVVKKEPKVKVIQKIPKLSFREKVISTTNNCKKKGKKKIKERDAFGQEQGEPQNFVDYDSNGNNHLSMILQIRNYINCFPDKLKTLYIGSLDKFLKGLHKKSLLELHCILEEIRTEMNVSQHLNLFLNSFNLLVTSVEKASCFVGYDVSGLSNDIQLDQGFADTLKMIACEITLSLSPPKQLLIRLARAVLLRYNLNLQQKKLNLIKDIKPVQELVDKYKNL